MFKEENYELQLIHINDRNCSYKANSNIETFFYKKSRIGEPISKETIALRFFKKACPSIILNSYPCEKTDALVLEWIEYYNWIEYDVDCSVENPYSNIVSFISTNCERNQYKKIINQLTSDEIAHLAKTKNKLLAMYTTVYKSLLKNQQISVFTNSLISNYKYLLDKFVFENNCLIHGDLNRSNILIKEQNIKIVDFEFSTFSSAEFEVGRLLASFFMLGIEQARRGVAYDRIVQNSCYILNELNNKNIIDKTLTIKYIGFYIVNIVFYHKNNFTRIKSKEEYIKYYIPFADLLMKYEKSTISYFLENGFINEFLNRIM